MQIPPNTSSTLPLTAYQRPALRPANAAASAASTAASQPAAGSRPVTAVARPIQIERPGAAFATRALTRSTPDLAPTATPAEKPAEAQAAPTLEGLMKAWGTNDPAYDFNQDNVVDVEDLVHFITNYPKGDAPAPQKPDEVDDSDTKPPERPVSVPSTPALPDDALAAQPLAAAPPDPDEGPKLTMEGLMQAWGQQSTAKEPSPYDLNGDGVVDVEDLVQFVLKHPGQAHANIPASLGVDYRA